MREISIGQRTIFFDRLHDGVRIAHLGEFRFELRIVERRIRAIDLDLVISCDVDGWKHFKSCLKSHRLAIGEMQAGDLRLRNRLNTLLFDGRAKLRRQNLLQYILLNWSANFLRITDSGTLPARKPGIRAMRRILLDHCGKGATYFVGGHFHIDLASALRIESRAVIMRVVVVVLMIVLRSAEFSAGEFVSWLVARVDSCAPVSSDC